MTGRAEGGWGGTAMNSAWLEASKSARLFRTYLFDRHHSFKLKQRKHWQTRKLNMKVDTGGALIQKWRGLSVYQGVSWRPVMPFGACPPWKRWQMPLNAAHCRWFDEKLKRVGHFKCTQFHRPRYCNDGRSNVYNLFPLNRRSSRLGLSWGAIEFPSSQAKCFYLIYS